MLNLKNVEHNLAKELQKRKHGANAVGIENKRICAESEEIKELLSKIKHAYMNKERAAQQHEKQVRQIREIREEAQMDDMMLRAREHEKNIMLNRIKEEKESNLLTKQILFDQMDERQRQVDEAREQYLAEKIQVNDIVDKINQDERRKQDNNHKKQKQCYQDMLDSLADKAKKIQKAKDTEEEENRLYLIHLAKKVARQKNFAQQKEEVERAKEKIFKKLKAEQEERDRQAEEIWQLQEVLNREVLDKKVRDQEALKRAKLAEQKEMMRIAEIEAKATRIQKEREIERQKEIYQKQYQEAWEADVRLEQMTAEKRKKKLLEHRHEIERLWQKKLEQFKREKDDEINKYQQSQALEAYKQKIIQQEKERLLREHLPYIQDFLPKGILEKSDPNKISNNAGASYR